MTRRKDGYWQESVKLPDGKRKYFYGKTKTEVLQKINAFRAKQADSVTYASVQEDWWRDHIDTLSPTTAQGYRSAMTRTADYFGKTPIADITPRDCLIFLQGIADSGLSAKSVRTARDILTMVFRYGVGQGVCDSCPTRDIETPKGAAPIKRDSALPDDIAKIKKAAGSPASLFYKIALYCGLRRGEIAALKWEDIDLDAKEIHVNKSVYYLGETAQIKEPKTKSGTRFVPINDALLSDLKATKPKTGFVFGGKAPYRRYELSKTLERFRQDNGISCGCHQLRHTYATVLVENGIDVKLAQYILGHAQITTTMDIYAEIRESYRRKTSDTLRALKFD